LKKLKALIYIFKKYDKNGSGNSHLTAAALDVHELDAMFRKNNIRISYEDLMSLFQIIDANNDG
jgi:hypothetical protein